MGLVAYIVGDGGEDPHHITPNLVGICFPVPSQLGLTGAIVSMMVLFLSCMMEIDQPVLVL